VVRPLSSEYSVQLGFSFSKTLGRNLEPYRNATLNQDFDVAGIIDGKEGSGKSVFAQQVAAFLDKDHTLDVHKQICFTPEQFREAVTTLPPGKAIVWDEARSGLNRRRSTKEVNIEITDMLAECRQKNLFMVIVMPTFYDMDMNVAVWRTRFLLHVWYSWEEDPKHPEPLIRGFFRYYSEEGKKKLYTNKWSRQRYEYPFLQGDSFENTFPKFYVASEEEYKKRKREAMRAYKTNQKDTWAIIHHLREKGILRDGYAKLIGDFIEVGESTVYRYLSSAAARINL